MLRRVGHTDRVFIVEINILPFGCLPFFLKLIRILIIQFIVVVLYELIYLGVPLDNFEATNRTRFVFRRARFVELRVGRAADFLVLLAFLCFWVGPIVPELFNGNPH